MTSLSLRYIGEFYSQSVSLTLNKNKIYVYIFKFIFSATSTNNFAKFLWLNKLF